MKFLVLLCLVAWACADDYADGYHYYGPQKHYGYHDYDYHKHRPHYQYYPSYKYPDQKYPDESGRHDYRYSYIVKYPWSKAVQGKHETNKGGVTRGSYFVDFPSGSNIRNSYHIKH